MRLTPGPVGWQSILGSCRCAVQPVKPLLLHLLARCCTSTDCCSHLPPTTQQPKQPGQVQPPALHADHQRGMLLAGINIAVMREPIVSVLCPAALQPVLPCRDEHHTLVVPSAAEDSSSKQS